MSFKLADLKKTQIEELDKDKTVVMIGIAPIEQHSIHLPLGVDIYETEHWIKGVIEKLELVYNKYTFLTMPIIPFGFSDIKGSCGDIHVSQKLIYKLVIQVLEAIASWQVKNIVIISGHADPKHQIAIEQACYKINKRYKDIAFSPMGYIFSNNECKHDGLLSDKLNRYKNDFHAGWIETSCMLDISPGLVDAVYKKLPDFEIKPLSMMFPNKVNKKIKNFGHIGYPRESSVELGRRLNEDMINQIQKCISAFLNRENYKIYEHHELYKIPIMKVKKWR
ncbi:creatininase family protein [Clostridiaceae bacterium M8S5]|nr:creatininase family protein [Clostridiaceae bacterium M8S5]